MTGVDKNEEQGRFLQFVEEGGPGRQALQCLLARGLVGVPGARVATRVVQCCGVYFSSGSSMDDMHIILRLKPVHKNTICCVAVGSNPEIESVNTAFFHKRSLCYLSAGIQLFHQHFCCGTTSYITSKFPDLVGSSLVLILTHTLENFFTA